MSWRWVRKQWKRRVWMYGRRRLHPEVTVGIDDFRLTVDFNDRVLGRMLYLGEDHDPEHRAPSCGTCRSTGACASTWAPTSGFTPCS